MGGVEWYAALHELEKIVDRPSGVLDREIRALERDGYLATYDRAGATCVVASYEKLGLAPAVVAELTFAGDLYTDLGSQASESALDAFNRLLSSRDAVTLFLPLRPPGAFPGVETRLQKGLPTTIVIVEEDRGRASSHIKLVEAQWRRALDLVPRGHAGGVRFMVAKPNSEYLALAGKTQGALRFCVQGGDVVAVNRVIQLESGSTLFEALATLFDHAVSKSNPHSRLNRLGRARWRGKQAFRIAVVCIPVAAASVYSSGKLFDVLLLVAAVPVGFAITPLLSRIFD